MEFDAIHHCLVLTMDHGKVNALSQPLRQYLCDGLQEAGRREDVQWVLLRGKSDFFSAGADLAEVSAGTANAAPSVASVLQAIEQSTKPVVALLDGQALGGGFELAMACHARMATPSAKVGLPESKIGLIPGAGGTQRLPRAIGVNKAMDLMLSGTTVFAKSFEGTPLVQKIVPENDLVTVLSAGQAVVSQGVQLLRDLSLPMGEVTVQPKKATDVSRALRELVGVQFPDFEAGLTKEYATFCALREMPSSRALRHIFAAEQRAAKIDGLEPASAGDLRHIGMVGAGTMGMGIAIAMADSGRTVHVVDRTEEALVRARKQIDQHYAAQVKKGRLTSTQAQSRLEHVQFSTRTSDLMSVDLVIEAVFEDYGVKETVLADIAATVRSDAIIATNTSALDANRLAKAVTHPQRFVGCIFSVPPISCDL